ncbi:IclR family transcriptional regulator [Litoreibacter ponti]|uniref:IclR family transcriptional regulator n=1 Tax=Litoreibacter ponti TaxID=1510457 RepID=A0A2T6BDN6_9RHOB|nr:HTH-type transcriptional regulator BhcR [Litoreibacter ponti]PTX54161.1 IclR family transcriptional regulator [Litoreibacter ponti]
MLESAPKKRARGRPKAFNDKSEQNTVQSLERALSVLKHLAEQRGIALSDLAKETDQSPATLYRILTTFQLHQMTEFDENEQLWHIGAGAYRVGANYLRRTSVVERSRPVMRQLMQDTGETANLGVEQADMVLFVSQVETHESIRAFFPPGTQSKMHASGIGKALLAYYPPERLDQWFLQQRLTRYTDATITDPDVLRQELADIRVTGLSFDNEEKNIGMRCIASPVFDGFGEPVAGLSVSGPSSRMTDAMIDAIGAHVKAAAARVTEAVGGQPPER